MKLHSLHNPKLFIDDTEVKSMISATFSDNGANQLQSLNAVISDPDLEDMPLMNKKVELFLNNGSIDSAPIFRGFINEFTPSDKSFPTKLSLEFPSVDNLYFCFFSAGNKWLKGLVSTSILLGILVLLDGNKWLNSFAIIINHNH